MLRIVRVFLLMALAVALPMRTLAAQDHQTTVSPTISASPAHPAPAPDTLPLNLMAFAVVGATAARRMNLSRSYLFTDGQTYGPGVDVEVPEGFPDLDDKGDVIHPPGSTAARNQAGSRRLNASAPNTGGVNTGEGTGGSTGTGASVSGKSATELETMDKAALVDLAAEKGIEVQRLDDAGEVEDGEPLKRDYVRALGATATR